MTARCVMVLGTSSGAGKSWLATALCRHYANQGLKVAPFKAQNMSNNARVVMAPTLPAVGGSLPPEGALAEGSTPPRSAAALAALPPGGALAEGSMPPRSAAAPAALPPAGALAALGRPGGGSGATPTGGFGEIGSAQYFQALAARARPDVRMNPLLLKPEADTHSQVVLLGQVSAELTALPWRGRSERVWPQIAAALDALRAENDVVVIEGAGSPAEINLMASDVVNLRVARHADARCLLVTDIDRGGAFAHLYGTWALLAPEDRARIAGFVLNKFRGDAALLAPAPQQLQQLTGVPTVAVVPMRFGHGLPEEDGVFDAAPSVGFQAKSASGPTSDCATSYSNDSDSAPDSPRHIAVIAYPRISNLDEFQPLKNVPGLRLIWARTPGDLAGADTLILPGSKATAADLAWLRAQGLDAAIAQHAARGGRVLGVCGGLQMLGEALIDVHGVERSVFAAGPPQGENVAPLGGSATRAAVERGGSAAAGPPQGENATPLGGSAIRAAVERGGSAAAGPPQGENAAPMGGSATRAAVERGGSAAAGPPQGENAAPLGGSATRAAVERGGYSSNAPGLGLLPLVTSFEPTKTVRSADFHFGTLTGAWAALSGVTAQGYEIHSGQTAQHPAMAAAGDVAREVVPGLAWQNAAGNVLGCYVHGLFEDARVLQALFGAEAPSLDAVFDGLARDVAQAFEPGALARLLD